jgi:hypothetical protein
MNKDFSIDYIINDKSVALSLGQVIFYINTQYRDEYEYCKECRQGHSIGKKYFYDIIPATICGFEIKANHCFSYSVNNPFTLRIQVIDENDHEKTLEVEQIYFDKDAAKEKIDNRKSDFVV